MAIDMMQMARELAMSEEEMLREAMRALLRTKVHSLDVERRARCAKYGVSSLQELDQLIREGKVEEDAVLDDFQNVDYLTNRITRFEKLLGEI